MTVSTTAIKSIGLGNGATTLWSYNFLINLAGDVLVMYTDATGVNTTIGPSLYSITGLGNPAGGTVTYPLSGPAIANGTKLTIARNTPDTQLTDLVSQGSFSPDVVETGLDDIVLALQQSTERGLRSIRAPITDSAPTMLLPSDVVRASKYLFFDSSGNVSTIAGVPASVGPIINVTSFGAKGDGVTDDLPAINAAIAALPLVGGAVYLPAPNVGYLISATITIPSNRSRYTIFGDGFGSRIIKNFADGTPMMTWQSPGLNLLAFANCIIRDLCLDANNKAGDCLKIENAQLVKVWRVFPLGFNGTSNGITITGGGTTASSSNELHNIYADGLNGGNAAILITATARDILVDGLYHNGNFVCKHSIQILNSGAVQIANVHPYNVTDNIINIQGGLGAYLFTGCVFDNSNKDLVFIDGSVNAIDGVMFSNCRFQAPHAGFSCALLKTTKTIQFHGCTFVVGPTIRYAVEETVSADRTLILGGSYEGTPQFATANLLIGAASRTLGIDPQVWTVGQIAAGCTIGTVAAGATVFLGVNAAQAAEDSTMFTIPRAGNIVRVRVETLLAPGVGKNFTYTLRKNTADTAVTGVISGNASFSVNLATLPIAVAVDDRLTIKLVTDAASTVTQHRYSITIDA